MHYDDAYCLAQLVTGDPEGDSLLPVCIDVLRGAYAHARFRSLLAGFARAHYQASCGC